MNTLVVMTGAGASYDCASKNTAQLKDGYRPPLVNELFELRPTFGAILHKYPDAESLSEAIREQIRPRATRAPESLESILASLASSEVPQDRRMFLQVPLYLQELLGEVSSHYIEHGATKYHAFVQKINRQIGKRYDHVVYLTVNYDRLLDCALEQTYSASLASMGRYLQENWCLIKLHGSVDWGIPLFKVESSEEARNLAVLGSKVSSYGQIIAMGAELKRLPGHQSRTIDRYFHYPALAVPLAGKSGFVCPSSHLECAITKSKHCVDVIIAGCRMIDEDVQELFARLGAPARFLVVAESGNACDEVRERLQSKCANFASAKPNIFARGFASFVGSTDFAEFLAGK